MKDQDQSSVTQFNEWAKDYDKKYYWPFFFSNNYLIQVLNPEDHTSILDVGCGTGILLDQLLKLNKSLNLFGIDISSEMIKMALKKFDKTNINLQVCTAEDIPFEDNSFDYLTCSTSFHHYSKPDIALKEMFRVLKPNGKLLLLDPFTNGWIRKLICKGLDILFKENGTNLFTKKQMKIMFENAGFTNIKQKHYLFYKLVTIGTKKNS